MDSFVKGLIQSTQLAYSSGVSAPKPTTSPEPSTTQNSASAPPPSK